MAQLKHRRTQRRLARVGAIAKPGITALLLVGVLGAGVVGQGISGFATSFDIRLPDTSQTEELTPDATSSDQPSKEVSEPQETYYVHVDGAVASPGVYELKGEDLRLTNAIEAAGGLLENADTSGVNLAAPIVDGSKVHIPTLQESYVQSQSPSSTQESSSSAHPTLVNINSATLDQLCTLSGIGEATAANIISDREQNGPFTCIEDLMRVSGIGKKKFERVKDHICV